MATDGFGLFRVGVCVSASTSACSNTKLDPGAAGRTVPPVLTDQPPPIPPSAGPVLLSTLFDFHLRTLNQVKKMSQTILNLLVGRQKAGGPIRIG